MCNRTMYCMRSHDIYTWLIHARWLTHTYVTYLYLIWLIHVWRDSLALHNFGKIARALPSCATRRIHLWAVTRQHCECDVTHTCVTHTHSCVCPGSRSLRLKWVQSRKKRGWEGGIEREREREREKEREGERHRGRARTQIEKAREPKSERKKKILLHPLQSIKIWNSHVSSLKQQTVFVDFFGNSNITL